VFGLTVDSPETQIDRQLDSASRIQFWKEVGKSTSGLNRKSNRDSQAIMRVATRWMKQPNSNIKKLVITVLNAKIPSTGDRRRAHFWEISLVARQAMRLGNPVMFLDSSPKHQGRSSERLGNKFGFLGSHRFRHQEGFDMKNINALKKSKNKMLVLSVNPQTTQDKHWSDDNPHFLGQRVKKFSKDKNETLDVVIAEPDGHIVFLSEKIEFTMKVRDVDSNGAHWFSRNFRGYVMRNHPQTHPDSPEYRRLYHEWVPFETNHVNAPIFDKHGYVIIKETATLAHFPKGYVSGRLAFQALIKRA
jgi:hypothetical protein